METGMSIKENLCRSDWPVLTTSEWECVHVCVIALCFYKKNQLGRYYFMT